MPETGGQSPARQAWRRLRRNIMAMIGLGIVIIVGLMTTLAPWITQFDPTEQRTWLQAQPPGFTHPDVLQENRFIIGQAAESSQAVEAGSHITLSVRQEVREEYRLGLRRKRISSIIKTNGAEQLTELDLQDPKLVIRQKQRGGELGEALPAALIQKGKAPPEGYFADGGRLMLLDVVVSTQTSTVQVQLDEGIVTGITGHEGDKLVLSGDQIINLHVDGTETTVSHLLGTDTSGRDLFSRILYGGQISLLVGLVATAVSLLIGVVYGALSGYLGGRWDRLLMNIVDILYGLPFMFLVILLLVNFGRNIIVLFAALGAVQWLTMARIVRGQILALRGQEYIAAAQLSGATTPTILFRHLIPNCMGPVVIYTTLTVPLVILEESFLAFIGLQVQWGGESLDSWGALVKYGVDNRGDHFSQGWLLLWPALAMSVTLLALNALGSGLRDALDPKLQGQDG